MFRILGEKKKLKVQQQSCMGMQSKIQNHLWDFCSRCGSKLNLSQAETPCRLSTILGFWLKPISFCPLPPAISPPIQSHCSCFIRHTRLNNSLEDLITFVFHGERYQRANQKRFCYTSNHQRSQTKRINNNNRRNENGVIEREGTSIPLPVPLSVLFTVLYICINTRIT